MTNAEHASVGDGQGALFRDNLGLLIWRPLVRSHCDSGTSCSLKTWRNQGGEVLPSNEGLEHMIDIVEPLPGRREEARQSLMRQIEVMQEADDSVANDPASNISASEYREALKKLSKTLTKAAEQVRRLGSLNRTLEALLRVKLESEDEKSLASMVSYLDICAQTADDLAEHLVIPKGAPLPDWRKSLAVSAAYSILKHFSPKRRSSTDGGALCSLAEAIFQHAFKEDATGKLERYLKREIKFHKEWALKSGE